MKLFTTILLLAASTTAFATGNKPVNTNTNNNYNKASAGAVAGAKASNHNQVHNKNYNKNHNSNTAKGGSAKAYGGDAEQGQLQGQLQGQKQGQQQSVGDTSSYSEGSDAKSFSHTGASTSSVGDTKNTNVAENEGNTVNIDGGNHSYKEAANTAIAGFGNTTASCFRTYGLGFSSRDNSTSLGVPFKDGDCALSEAAGLAFANGNASAGWKMYCNQNHVKRVYGAKRKFGFILLYREQTHREAVQACLTDAYQKTQSDDVLRALSNITFSQSDRILSLEDRTDHISDLERRIQELETVAHPKGKGFTGDMVRKITREEIKAADPACCNDE